MASIVGVILTMFFVFLICACIAFVTILVLETADRYQRWKREH